MHAPGHDAAGRRADPERWAMLDAEAKAAKAAAGGPTMGGDLASFAASLGIDTGGLAGPVGTERDPFFGAPASDYPVLVKRGKRGKGTFGVPSGPSDFANRKKVALQSQLLRDFYRLDPSTLSSLQRRLLAGGFYPGDVEEEDLALGTHDEDTLKAYERAITRAAAFHEAGEDKTLDDVIADAAKSNAGKERKGPKRAPLVVELSDPADVRRGVEAVARKAMGRKLSDAEREKFVGLWQSIEAQSQKAAYAAAETGGTITSAPTFEAFAAERIAREYGVEVEAHNLAETGGDFMELLREVGG